MEVTCDNCGNTLSRSPAHVRRMSFCNIACRRAYYRRPIKCAGCSELFPRDPAQPRRKYCTWGCFRSSRQTEADCVVCGTRFQTYVSEQRKRVKRGHVACCSRDCRNVYTSRFLGGDGKWAPAGTKNPKRSRIGWRKVRNIYLTHVGGVCEGCESEPATEVHHLIPVSNGGPLLSFDNLMAVCRPCHENMHQQLRAGAFNDVIGDIRAHV